MNKRYLALLGLPMLLTACSVNDSANSQESNTVGRQQSIYTQAQPVPVFDWSLERNLLIKLYEARNNAVVTYSYVRNLNGQVVFTCKSIGFPIPSNTQLTNPQAIAESHQQWGITLPQAEPNGTYTSPSTAGTYVFCLNEDGTVSPSYFEANVEAHTAPLTADQKTVTADKTLEIKTTK